MRPLSYCLELSFYLRKMDENVWEQQPMRFTGSFTVMYRGCIGKKLTLSGLIFACKTRQCDVVALLMDSKIFSSSEG